MSMYRRRRNILCLCLTVIYMCIETCASKPSILTAVSLYLCLILRRCLHANYLSEVAELTKHAYLSEAVELTTGSKLS